MQVKVRLGGLPGERVSGPEVRGRCVLGVGPASRTGDSCTPTGPCPLQGRTLASVYRSIITVSKFLTVFEQVAIHLHFALGPKNNVARPNRGFSYACGVCVFQNPAGIVKNFLKAAPFLLQHRTGVDLNFYNLSLAPSDPAII